MSYVRFVALRDQAGN